MVSVLSTQSSSLLHASSASSSGRKALSICFLSTSAISTLGGNAIFLRVSKLSVIPLPQCTGLKYVRAVDNQCSPKNMVRKRKCKGKGVYASLFGVGAPEILVIGVVALLVFGPKGLAEVARNLGKTVRAFQPTIRELQDVSREFKSTLQREIGLDEVTNPVSTNFDSNPAETAQPNPSDGLAKQFLGTLSQLQKEQQEESEKSRNESAAPSSSGSSDPSVGSPDDDSSVVSSVPQRDL